MKRILLYIVVFLQVVILGYLVAEREYTLRSGKEVWLRTEPIDPMDILRGQYVVLNYEISRPNPELYSPELTQKIQEAVAESGADIASYRYLYGFKTPVYVSLSLDEKGVGRVNYVDVEPPQDKSLFLKGIFYREEIEYDIEKLFVQEGMGPEIESRARNNPRSLEIKIRVNRKGVALIETYRWGGVEMLFEQANDGTTALILENYDEAPAALLLPKDLSTIEFFDRSLEKEKVAKRRRYNSEDILIIPAKESVRINIPLDFFKKISKNDLYGSIIYRLPDEELLPPLPKGISEWVKTLRTNSHYLALSNGDELSVE